MQSKSDLKESEVPKKVLTTAEIRDLMKNYQPGKVTALPQMMTHQASQLTLLRQL